MAQRTRAASKSAPVKSPVQLPTDNSLNKSMGNEKKTSNSQDDVLRDIVAELKNLKECVGKTVKNDELKTVITSTIKEILNDHKVEMEELWDEKNKALIDIIDAQKNEIENLKSKIHEMTTENEEFKKMAQSAMSKANWNEQYSRKNNIKVHGVKEQAAENTKAVVQTLIKENTNATLNDEDIIAIHRIPGRKGYDRPILVRLKNNNSKSAIMKQRSEIKRKSKGAYRLSDDVTKLNSDLINKLAKNDQISSAWYFNGHVYGQVGGVKVIFDIYDDVEAKIGDIMFRKNSG